MAGTIEGKGNLWNWEKLNSEHNPVISRNKVSTTATAAATMTTTKGLFSKQNWSNYLGEISVDGMEVDDPTKPFLCCCLGTPMPVSPISVSSLWGRLMAQNPCLYTRTHCELYVALFINMKRKPRNKGICGKPAAWKWKK